MTARDLLDAQVSEADLQGFVVAVAAVNGWRVYHAFDSRRSTPGWPDLTLVRDGRLIFAELKTVKGRVSAAQQGWLSALGAVPGVTVVVWRPSDTARITETLR